MRTAATIAWLIVAAGAGLMGLLLVMSQEPGATAGRWLLLYAVVGGGVVLSSWRGASPRWFAIVSLGLTVLMAAHAVGIIAFAYQGLANIVIVIAAIATLFATIAWFRSR